MTCRTLIALTLLACACPAAAQGTVQFFPRYDFHLGAEHLSQDDPRFVWDTNFGGEMDLVDYGAGRATFAANYEAVLGNQFRAFDPNQGNYLLDLSSSVRLHGYEIAALLHHTSRHLSDRFKRLPVDWNGIVRRGRAVTNYQILPGDRIYIQADSLVTVDNFLAKVISPVERVFGITLLGSTTVRSFQRSGGSSGSNTP